jgi:membrane fusion protein, multidrug efflux system
LAFPVRKAAVAVLASAVIGSLAWYVHYDRTLRFFQETNDATIQADQVAIAAKLAGYVRSVAVADNQQVAAGALLIEIDPLDFRTTLSQADAGIATALAAQQTAHASQAEAMTAIAHARAGLQAALASRAWAGRETQRYRKLVAEGIAPAEKLSELTAAREKAEAEVAAARATLAQSERRIGTLAAQSEQLAAQTGAARVQREAASNDLAATRLAAPVAGRVANRTVRAGQYVQPGTRLMTIVPSDEMHVVANFKETQVGLMRPGQPVRIEADALPGIDFRGAVVSIAPGTGANFSLIPPQNATGNFTKIVQRVPVRIRIDAGPAARKVLSPGLSLTVEVDTRAGKGEMDAIRAEQERARK